MRGRRCTIDSSCLIALDHVGLIPALSVLFSGVLVPKAVRTEVNRRRATRDRLRAVFRDYDFFQPCDAYDQAAVDILLASPRLRDRGEAEAVAQASQLGAAVIVDDRWGRELAARHSLECHGTLWVLDQLHAAEFISSAQVREALLAKRNRTIRLPGKAVDDLLTRIGEERGLE